MSLPSGDNAFLHDLEDAVSAELTQAQLSQPPEEAAVAPVEQWLFDPADAQRDEVGLRSLLGAIRSLEEQ